MWTNATAGEQETRGRRNLAAEMSVRAYPASEFRSGAQKKNRLTRLRRLVTHVNSTNHRVIDDGILIREVYGTGFVLRQVPVNVDILQHRLLVLARLGDL